MVDQNLFCIWRRLVKRPKFQDSVFTDKYFSFIVVIAIIWYLKNEKCAQGEEDSTMIQKHEVSVDVEKYLPALRKTWCWLQKVGPTKISQKAVTQPDQMMDQSSF